MWPHTVLVLETEHHNEEDRVEQGDSKGYKVVERPAVELSELRGY